MPEPSNSLLSRISLNLALVDFCYDVNIRERHLYVRKLEANTLSGKLKDCLKMYISLRGARATGLCQIGKSSAPGIKQNAKAVQIVLL
jgi:hypothetical protein